ncbi:aminomethyl-transferring glycine dehydrogenase subunit GcvPA [Pseudoflavonifractor sp. MSJ-37]|uniref:aminomethyl-transferring glycine dehydrogenase subunit GcvPA n=1 Tax=Pseudoflavonifractor sp. MSJ-37 TaxID=2841531 RepID=UPI001C112182|nr:aminomethyl-transferring glycine dehydrogenase subunit GcvPA [Pseudoflavonifractor sp. MSJ-37]MBU5434334.1 aminomethyl-transferring glycine dehydrogenase subunit GcvPA [Pseudoflavonifractor sp. MSJ-37]
MSSYLCSTPEERQAMVESLGLKSMDDLYADVPAEVMIHGPLDLPAPKSELEISRTMESLAKHNTRFRTILRGAGAERHYIPSAVTQICRNEIFVTAYTPYQAEVSQGILQSIFEYQTMICELTGMDVSNASVYDGGTAAAEATAMCRDRKRSKVLVSETVHPDALSVIKTYSFGSNTEVIVVPSKDGVTDKEALKSLLADDSACFYVQQPNFYGQLEDCDELGEIVHAAGAKYIIGSNPATLGVLKSQREYGADIAVGEAQPLGMPLAWGGPYLGYMACTTAMMRKLPGRIVGETTDDKGERAFVLTMQAREQHIRREKASSNICSNQALCALTASVYLAEMGPVGLAEVGDQCYAKAHYLASELCKIDGIELVHPGEFFHEFVTTLPEADRVLCFLEQKGILGGLPVKEGVLWCVTEYCTKADLDEAVAVIKEAYGK